MDEMEKTLREELEKHLDTLRRNLEVVPMDVLKTKYKKPYQELKESICKAATAYTRHVSLGGIRIKQKYGDEATSYANEAVKDSQCLKRISEAAFERQDMNEIAALAKQLREEILQVRGTEWYGEYATLTDEHNDYIVISAFTIVAVCIIGLFYFLK